MNIDFLILVIIYLAIILAIHYNLKRYDRPKRNLARKKSILKDIPDITDSESRDVESELELKSIDDSIVSEVDSKLIIDKNELDNITDDASNDFLKYLKVEENDNNEIYRKLSDSMDINLTENVKSLDSYFPEKQEQYTFEEVPTLNKKNGLLDKVKNLNEEKIYADVYAFDEFNDNFALI